MTKDSQGPIYWLVLMVFISTSFLFMATIQIRNAVLESNRINAKQLELSDELLKLEWQLHGDELDAFYPKDPTENQDSQLQEGIQEYEQHLKELLEEAGRELEEEAVTI